MDIKVKAFSEYEKHKKDSIGKPFKSMGDADWFMAGFLAASSTSSNSEYKQCSLCKEGLMKDLNKFIKLYKSLGIDLKVNKDDIGLPYIMIGEGTYCDDNMTTSNKFSGYSGFYSIIRFDESGRFISQEFYE